MIFHVPLFARWLRQVMDKNVRVLMIIDGPDDLEQLMSPPGLKDAMKYAEGVYRGTKQVIRTLKSGERVIVDPAVTIQ